MAPANRSEPLNDGARRRRGARLTQAGLQRYYMAQRRLETEELGGGRASLERLSQELGLSTKTISRVLNRTMPVDVRSLDLLFTSLGMSLQPTDFVRTENQFVPNRLPPRRSAFFGRAEEIAGLRALLAERRVITLTGTGGVGKTRLALEVVERYGDDCFDRLVYCDLSVVTEAGVVEAAVIAAFGGQQDRRPAAAIISGIIDSERTLLVLDNCEHVLASVNAVVSTLLDGVEHLVVLSTSREPLDVDGETIVRVLPLEVPGSSRESVLAADALRNSAVALFVDRAKRGDNGFRLDDRAAARAIEIVSRVEGVPLAIELAASRASTSTLADISASLRDHLSSLQSDHGMHGARHRSARALVDWSYELLDEDEKQIFRSLAVFMGSFDARAVESVGVPDGALNVAAVIDRLVRKSLLFVDAAGESTRYRMLETVRQYAALKLHERGEAATVHLHHALYFYDLLEKADAQSTTTGQRLQFDSIATETANIREALEWCANQSDNVHIAAPICCKLFRFWDARGDFVQGERWLRRMLDCDSELCTKTTLAQLHEGLALLLFRQGMLDASMDHAKQAYRLYDDTGDARGRYQANNLLGIAALDAGDAEAARVVFERNLQDAGSVASAAQIVVTLNNFGRLRAECDGELDESLELFARSLTLARSIGMSVMASTTLMNLSEVSARLGRFDDAIDYACRGMEEAVAVGNIPVAASIALQRAAYRIRSSGFPAAHGDIVAAREAVVRHPYPLKLTYELDQFAEVLLDVGRAAGAALILGSVAAYREGTESEYPQLDRRHDDIVERVRSTLGERSYRPVYVRGKTFAIDEALSEATGN